MAKVTTSMSPARRTVSATCSVGTVAGAEGAGPGLRPTLSPSPCLGSCWRGARAASLRLFRFQNSRLGHIPIPHAPQPHGQSGRQGGGRVRYHPLPRLLPPIRGPGQDRTVPPPVLPSRSWTGGLVRATRHLQAADLHPGAQAKHCPPPIPSAPAPTEGFSPAGSAGSPMT